jgi:malate dehydrogenase (oxaloacetate-decarboxylating)(NADP+)
MEETIVRQKKRDKSKFPEMEKPEKVMVPGERGVKLIHNPVMNKGTAFSPEERERLGLKGLLPPRVISQELQAKRIVENLRKRESDLSKYTYLSALQDRNEHLFYYVVREHLEEAMPIIYTPTVGRACQLYGHIYQRSRGMYISLEDKGKIREVLMNWPHKDARVIVVTDGERILGLGDLGVSGMGIPVGKLALYTACAGVDPTHCLPITLDVGTNNEPLVQDPLYLGNTHTRVRGQAYIDFVDEFIEAVQEIFPDAVIQLEDFATDNAFTLLHRYQDHVRLFDDDIQGTASVALAGIYGAMRKKKAKLTDQKFLFLGAGEAGIGIGDLIVDAMVEEGMPRQEAMARNWFMDSKGLVCAARTDLANHKLPYAHDHKPVTGFLEAVKELQPTAIIGVSGQPKQFTKEVVELMSVINDQPIIFALSNPPSKSECSAEEAYTWSKGKAIFASGSPFPSFKYKGKNLVPGQGNNVYIFPGVGLGLVYSKAKIVSNRMFLEAAKVVADAVLDEELERGTIYPSFKRIRDVSVNIAAAVTQIAVEDGDVPGNLLTNIHREIRKLMYEPDYPTFL